MFSNGFCGVWCLKVSETFVFSRLFYFKKKKLFLAHRRCRKIGAKMMKNQCKCKVSAVSSRAPVKACLQPCAGLVSAVCSARLCSAVLGCAELDCVFAWLCWASCSAGLRSDRLCSARLCCFWARLSSPPARFGLVRRWWLL